VVSTLLNNIDLDHRLIKGFFLKPEISYDIRNKYKYPRVNIQKDVENPYDFRLENDVQWMVFFKHLC
jgi:hypothetical protein